MGFIASHLTKLSHSVLIPFLFVIICLPAFSQPVNTINNTEKILNCTILPDSGYHFSRIIKDKSLPFRAMELIKHASSYWYRIVVHNYSIGTQSYYLSVFPNYNNTLYYQDPDTHRWIGHNSGIYSKYKPSQFGYHPLDVAAGRHDTLYVWVDLNAPYTTAQSFKPLVKLTPKSVYDSKMQNINTAWLVGIVVLLLFFVNNFYVYLSFKDSSVLYYLIIQLGGIIYLTNYCSYFDFIFPSHIFSLALDDQLRYYDFNRLLGHVAILMIFYGFLSLSRSYLNTRDNLPVEDKIMKYSLHIYFFVSVCIATVNISGYCLETYTLPYDNLYCALIIGMFMFTSVKAYIRKVNLSSAFLLANCMPLLFMLSIPLFHLLVSPFWKHNYLLPTFCVVAQALGFSIALVTRTKSIQKELNAREIQSRELELDLKEIDYQNKLSQLEIAQKNAEILAERSRTTLLQETLNINQRELASSTLNMVQKTELLAFLKDQIQKLEWLDRYNTKKNLESLNSLLESNIQLDSDWGRFKVHFEQVHPNFFVDLKKKHPSLTSKEIRLYTYFQMNLTHKEIAALLAIDPASVRRAKSRLYKKMGISVQADQPEE
jgi:DNA-binding CsgD family transcriptional regulator